MTRKERGREREGERETERRAIGRDRAIEREGERARERERREIDEPKKMKGPVSSRPTRSNPTLETDKGTSNSNIH